MPRLSLVKARAPRRPRTALPRQIERMLHRLLTSPALSESDRMEVIGMLSGTRPGTGPLDPRYAGFSPAEQQLVARYRAASARQRRIISLLLGEFAEKKGRP